MEIKQPVPSRTPKERPGPVGGKREVNRRQRTQALTEAGLTLFLEEGLERVTIDSIVSRAKMAKGSFYRYFKDKEDLVGALLAPVRQEMMSATERCEQALDGARSQEAVTVAYGALGAELTQAFIAYPRVFRLYLQESRGPAVGPRRPVRALADEVTRRAVDLTRVAHRHGLFRPLKPEVTARAVVGAAEHLIFAVLSGEDVADPITISQTLISVVLEGMQPR